MPNFYETYGAFLLIWQLDSLTFMIFKKVARILDISLFMF